MSKSNGRCQTKIERRGKKWQAGDKLVTMWWQALKREPDNNLTWLLAAVLYLKLKKKVFNEGTQKETEEKFAVLSKQLSKLLSSRWWDVPKKPQRKSLRSLMAVKPPGNDDNDYDEGQQLVGAPDP